MLRTTSTDPTCPATEATLSRDLLLFASRLVYRSEVVACNFRCFQCHHSPFRSVEASKPRTVHSPPCSLPCCGDLRASRTDLAFAHNLRVRPFSPFFLTFSRRKLTFSFSRVATSSPARTAPRSTVSCLTASSTRPCSRLACGCVLLPFFSSSRRDGRFLATLADVLFLCCSLLAALRGCPGIHSNASTSFFIARKTPFPYSFPLHLFYSLSSPSCRN
jgi:hypothetical protein